ncbi:hypothetical protein KJ612_10770 [Myxococcota bacterium]|nr:hypothetical protein [Myxococcota bacterium]MBU1411055.1 hypothetical protein [Myxococcota bacterium]
MTDPRPSFPRWRRRISGVLPDDVARQSTPLALVNATLLGAGSFALLFGTLAWLRGNRLPAILDFSLTLLLALLYVRLQLRRDVARTAALATALGGLFFLALVAHGSVLESGFVWMLVYPVMALMVLGARRGALAAALVLAGALVCFGLSHTVEWIPVYSFPVVLRAVAVYLLLFLFTLIMEVTRTTFFTQLSAAHGEQSRQALQLERINEEKSALIRDLERNLGEVRALRGLLPICTGCGKLRDDDGYWLELGNYLSRNTDTVLTHGICPSCSRELYADFMPEKE